MAILSCDASETKNLLTMASEEEEHEEQFRDMVIELLLFISLNGVARPSH